MIPQSYLKLFQDVRSRISKGEKLGCINYLYSSFVLFLVLRSSDLHQGYKVEKVRWWQHQLYVSLLPDKSNLCVSQVMPEVDQDSHVNYAVQNTQKEEILKNDMLVFPQ